jgi:hypothetical protein
VGVRRTPLTGYLGDVDFFTCELDTEDEDDEDEDNDDDDVQVLGANDNSDDGGGPAWDPETQPPGISDEEAIAIAMASSNLDQLAMWDNLGVQIRESWLA